MYDEDENNVNVMDAVECSATNQPYAVIVQFYQLQLLTSIVFQELTPDTNITFLMSKDGLNFEEYFHDDSNSTVSYKDSKEEHFSFMIIPKFV